MRWQRYNFYFIKNTLKIKKIQADCACCEKGVLLDCKRITFGRQKESFWRAKGVHLKGKRSPFEKRLFLHPKTTGIILDWERVTAQATAGTP